MRNFAGAGVAGGSQAISGQLFSNQTVGVNNTTAAMMDRIKGKMNLDTDIGNADGDFSILGSKNKGAAKQTQSSVDGFDAIVSESSGALMTDDGIVLPGAGVGDVSAVQPIHSVTYIVPVPENAIGKLVVVDAVLSLDTGDGLLNTAVLKTTVECLETSESESILTGIPTDTERVKRTLGSVSLNGAANTQNRIKVTIERQAGNGEDDAIYTSLVIHSVRVRFNRSPALSRSDTSRILGFKSNGVRGL